MAKHISLLLILIIALAAAGMLDSGYAVYQHYAPTEEAFCNVNESVNCTAVNQSQYSEMYGVPAAGLGFGGYVLFAGQAVWPTRCI